jgi:hypothetical protein
MKTFDSFIIVVIILFCNLIKAQTPAWEWTRSPDGEAVCRSVAVNSEEDIFITGAFSNDLIFDSTTILTSAIFGDMFVATYGEDGQVLWVKRAFGNYGDEGRCIATGSSGNVYVTGEFFSNNITFDSLTLINNHITPYFDDATTDIFLVKYNQSSQVIWAKSGGGVHLEFVRGIAVDSKENITIVGTFWSSSVTFGSYTLTKTGNIDVFIVQYDSSGQLLWAKNPVGTDEENANSVAADTLGNVYMVGSFRSDSISFDNITLFCSSERFDTYIVKYDPFGKALWAENAVGNDWDETRSVTLDKSCNIYLTGHFQSDSIRFGSIILNKSMSNNIDMFLVKYDPNHQVVWARQSGGNIWSWVYPNKITIGSLGSIWITGVFIGDGLEFGPTSLPNYGSYDAYLVKYNENGNVLWAECIGGNKMDWGEGIAVDNYGCGYLSGYFESNSIVFGSTTLFNTTSRNKLFLAKKEAQTTSIHTPNLKDSINIIIPSEYRLYSNFPNPFNPTTTINYQIPELRFVTLKVYDVLGSEITTLVNEEKPVGSYQVEFGATELPSGIYFYQLKAGSFVETKKMVLMK